MEHIVGAFRLSLPGLWVGEGGYLALMGGHGSGKTALLECLCGLRPMRAGRVRIAGEDVTGRPPGLRGLAYVPQDGALFPFLDVAGNLAFPLRGRMPGREVAARVDEVADRLGLAPLLGRRIRGLSGGERQKVALGRALVRKPRALLLDEPAAALDLPARTGLCAELSRLHRTEGLTILHVCHAPEEARAVAGELAVLRDGRLVQVGPLAEVFAAPADPGVAALLGSPPAAG